MTGTECDDYKLSTEHRLTSLEGAVENVSSNVDLIRTNHLPHIQDAITDLRTLILRGLIFIIVTLVGLVSDIGLHFLH